LQEKSKMMEDENQRPEGEPEEPQLHWTKDLSEREKRLYEMWLKASAEEREIMLPLFELAGVQPPFTLPEPPEVVTPEMAALAIEKLIHQSAMLLRENMRVSMGLEKIDRSFADRLLGEATMTQLTYQQILKEVRTEIERQGKADQP
jgi:hypothetical protein